MAIHSQKALELKLSLEAGLIQSDVVLEWADSVISNPDSYEDHITDVSLAFKLSKKCLVELLDQIPGPRNGWAALRSILPSISELVASDPSRALSLFRYLETCYFKEMLKMEPPADLDFIMDITCVLDQIEVEPPEDSPMFREAILLFVESIERFTHQD